MTCVMAVNLDELLEQVQNEIDKVDAQIHKSRMLRGGPVYEPTTEYLAFVQAQKNGRSESAKEEEERQYERSAAARAADLAAQLRDAEKAAEEARIASQRAEDEAVLRLQTEHEAAAERAAAAEREEEERKQQHASELQREAERKAQQAIDEAARAKVVQEEERKKKAAQLQAEEREAEQAAEAVRLKKAAEEASRQAAAAQRQAEEDKMAQRRADEEAKAAAVQQQQTTPTRHGGDEQQAPAVVAEAANVRSSAQASSPDAGSPRPEAYKERIKIMLEHYAPKRLASVDALFARYAGNEEPLLTALVNKYGPEPYHSIAANQDAPRPREMSPPPAQLGAVDGAKVLDGASQSTTAAPTSVVTAATPSSPQELDASSDAQHDQQLQRLAGTTSQFASPEPHRPPESQPARDRVAALLVQYAPDRLPSLDQLLKKYEGNQEPLIQALVRKYGPEPPVGSVELPPQPSSPAPTGATANTGAPHSPTATDRNRSSISAASPPHQQGEPSTVTTTGLPLAPSALRDVSPHTYSMADFQNASSSSSLSSSSPLAAKTDVSETSGPKPPMPLASSPLSEASPQARPSVPTITLTTKQGYLWNYGRKGFFRSFKRQYLVVEPSRISWYKSEDDYKHHPNSTIDAIPLFAVRINSRGSKFKQPAVCLPALTPHECSKATDPTKFYFGIQWVEENGDQPILPLAAESAEERLAWLKHITKYIRLFVSTSCPNAEFFSKMEVGANPPLHVREVSNGEAPGTPRGGTPTRS